MSDLPMSKAQAQELTRWLKTNFGAQINAVLADTPFSPDIACAIACKETGPYLLNFTRELSAADALARCVFDASGDADGTGRRAFPRTTAEFFAVYEAPFVSMLIAEANKTRALRGMGPKQWVYKGYGLFQYDLQHISSDEDFFRQKQWYQFDACLARLRDELMRKYKSKKNVGDAIQAYNGSGNAAIIYRSHVVQLVEFCKEVP